MSRRLVVALGVLVLVIVCILIAVLVRTQPASNVQPSPTPTSTAVPSKPSQATMMVGVRDDSGEMADAILMGTEQTFALAKPTKGSWLSLQPGLALDIAPDGVITLAEEGPWDPSDSAGQVANQLGIRIGGGFVMDRLAFAAMVDAVGGVTVNTPVPVIATDPEDGKTKVVVKAGKHKLFGPAAALYVVTLSPGEAQTARMERFNEVWQQIVVTLPGNVDRVRGIVGSLGSSSRISMSADEISQILLTYQTALTDENVQVQTMPATSLGTGRDAIFTTAPGPAWEMTTAMFKPSIAVPGENNAKPRVRMVAAGISNSLALEAKSSILGAGFTFVWGGITDTTTTSAVYVPTEAALKTVGAPLSAALGVASATVDAAQSVGAQGAVVAGNDLYRLTSSTSKPASAS